MTLRARTASPADAAAITRIYNEGIEDRLGTFETRLRSAADVAAWFDGRHPIVVVEEDATIVAFASTSTYRSRDCYAGVAEFSVYSLSEFCLCRYGRRCPVCPHRAFPPNTGHFIQVGLGGAFGLGLCDLFRLKAAEPSRNLPGKDVNCILIWMDGGPSHYESFDPKPEAPSEIRGEFKPIPTKVPGIQFSECVPKLAAVADKFTVVRSICHKDPNHGGGNHYMMTGMPTPVPVACGAFVTFHPSSLLRIQDRQDADARFAELVDDLVLAARVVRGDVKLAS